MVVAYNGLIALKNQTVNAWKQIDVQLKRRHDLIPNLVNTVKGSMEFEKETLEAVVEARDPGDAWRRRRREGRRRRRRDSSPARSSKLFAVMEAYPDLKSSQNVRDLQEELSLHREQDRLRAAAL